MLTRHKNSWLTIVIAGLLGACSKGQIEGFQNAVKHHDSDEASSADAGVNEDEADAQVPSELPDPQVAVVDEVDAGDADATPTDDVCAPESCDTGDALPSDQHFADDGQCVRVVATAQADIGKLLVDPNGKLFGLASNGDIYRYTDRDCDGRFDDNAWEQFKWASSGGRGDDFVFDRLFSHVYATSPEGVVRWDYCFDPFGGGAPVPVVVGQPAGGHTTLRVDDEELDVTWTPDAEPGADPSTCVATTKRFDIAHFDPTKPFAWDEGEDVGAADGGNATDTDAGVQAWDWQLGDSEASVQVLGQATASADGATYVTIANQDGAADGVIYRIADQ